MNQHLKIAITGASGQVAYAFLFRVASGAMFGADTTLDLHLLDVDARLSSLDGVGLELEDCAFPLVKKVITTADLSAGFKAVDWVFLIGAAPRTANMERKDLLKLNGRIFRTQAEAISDFAARSARVLVVGNPCNTNALIAAKNAKNIPNENFFALAMLDQNRAKMQLAKKLNLPISTIKQLAIWGNHSATQFPDFYHAKANEKLVTEIFSDINWYQNEFIKTVGERGAEIIKKRGASSAASAANAIIATVKALETETESDDWFSIAKYAAGEYGINEELIFSFPCRTINKKLVVVENIDHGEFAQKKIAESLAELQWEKKQIKKMGLIE